MGNEPTPTNAIPLAPVEAAGNVTTNEKTYDNLQGEVDALESALEKNPDNEKLKGYLRQTIKVMEDILDRMDAKPEDVAKPEAAVAPETEKTIDGSAMDRNDAQDIGAKTTNLASATPGANQATQFQNSRGEMYPTREEALASEDDHWQMAGQR